MNGCTLPNTKPSSTTYPLITIIQLHAEQLPVAETCAADCAGFSPAARQCPMSSVRPMFQLINLVAEHERRTSRRHGEEARVLVRRLELEETLSPARRVRRPVGSPSTTRRHNWWSHWSE